MKIYNIKDQDADLVGVLSGLTISSFTGFSIYKYTMNKTGNKGAAIAAGILSGIGTLLAPTEVKLVAMAGSTAAIANTL